MTFSPRFLTFEIIDKKEERNEKINKSKIKVIVFLLQ